MFSKIYQSSLQLVSQIGLSRSDKGTAGLAALLGFLIMNATMNGLLTITGTLAKDQLAQNGQGIVLGIQTVETGVFGGIITGIMTAILHNKISQSGITTVFRFLWWL